MRSHDSISRGRQGIGSGGGARRWLYLLPLALVLAQASPVNAQFELGDAVYNSIEVGCFTLCYDHAGIVVGVKPDEYGLPEVRIVEGTIPAAREVSLGEFGMEWGPYTRASYDFGVRRSAAENALDLRG